MRNHQSIGIKKIRNYCVFVIVLLVLWIGIFIMTQSAGQAITSRMGHKQFDEMSVHRSRQLLFETETQLINSELQDVEKMTFDAHKVWLSVMNDYLHVINKVKRQLPKTYSRAMEIAGELREIKTNQIDRMKRDQSSFNGENLLAVRRSVEDLGLELKKIKSRMERFIGEDHKKFKVLNEKVELLSENILQVKIMYKKYNEKVHKKRVTVLYKRIKDVDRDCNHKLIPAIEKMKTKRKLSTKHRMEYWTNFADTCLEEVKDLKQALIVLLNRVDRRAARYSSQHRRQAEDDEVDFEKEIKDIDKLEETETTTTVRPTTSDDDDDDDDDERIQKKRMQQENPILNRPHQTMSSQAINMAIPAATATGLTGTLGGLAAVNYRVARGKKGGDDESVYDTASECDGESGAETAGQSEPESEGKSEPESEGSETQGTGTQGETLASSEMYSDEEEENSDEEENYISSDEEEEEAST